MDGWPSRADHEPAIRGNSNGAPVASNAPPRVLCAEGHGLIMASVGERLHLLYELNRGLTSFTDMDGLLRYVTDRARELFNAEGCALLLLDRRRGEFYFPVASESKKVHEIRLATVRFPADRGIAGWVLAHDEAVLIDDVSKDARFFAGVDARTDMTTRRLLCAPLRTRCPLREPQQDWDTTTSSGCPGCRMRRRCRR